MTKKIYLSALHRWLLVTTLLSSSLAIGSEPSHKTLFEPNALIEQDRITQSDLVKNDHLTWLHNGEASNGVKTIIQNSKQFLFINLLALACDDSTEAIILLLEKKAKEGVDIRINLNRMYAIGSGACHKRLEAAGILIQKTNTHSSYYTNDSHELLIGSQSLAKMFINSDGQNGWDRDSMLWLEGPSATDALRDFLSLWKNSGNEVLPADSMQKYIQYTLNEETRLHRRGITSPKSTDRGLCRFVSQHPDGELRSLQRSLHYYSERAQKHIRFSGVKFTYSEKQNQNSLAATQLLEKLRSRSQAGLQVTYFGNGIEGGNGELTMILKELSENLLSRKWHFLAKAVQGVMNWDSQRTTTEHFKNYSKFSDSAKPEILTYRQFLHYKIWNFDDAALLISSANLTDDSFNKFSESGVLCFDQKLIREWNQEQDKDRAFSNPFSVPVAPPYK